MFFSAFVDTLTKPIGILAKLIPDLTGSAAQALQKGIPDVLDVLLGGFGTSAAGGVDPRTPFNPNTTNGLPTSFDVTQNITRGQGFGSGIFSATGNSSKNGTGPLSPPGGSAGTGRGMGGDQVARVAYNAGFRGQNLIKAVAVSEAESGFNPSIQGDVGIQDAKWGPSIGLWQIRSLKAQKGTGQERDASRLMDPQFNAGSAFSIAHGGTSFGAWSAYNSGAYLKYMQEAQADAHLAGVGDMPDMGAFSAYNYTAPTPALQGGDTWYNTFHINASSNGNSGSGGGVALDMRRTVTQLADQLEAEMRRRKLRMN